MPGAIDVMLPYYGDVGYLKEAVASVLAQQHREFRLVVLDDGFPDPEPERYCRELAARDSRVVYLRNPENLGANGNYRRALELVEADWFVMMGADDVMLPDYLSTIARVVRQVPSVDVIQPGVEVIDGGGAVWLPLADRVKRWYAPARRSGRIGLLTAQAMATSLVRADWAYFPSLAWRTSVVRGIGFRPGLDVVQDLALLLDIAFGGGTLAVTEPVVFRYRRHAASDSSVRAVDGRRFTEEARFLSAEGRRFAGIGWHRAARAARARTATRLHCVVTAVTAARRGRFSAVLPLLGQAISR